MNSEPTPAARTGALIILMFAVAVVLSALDAKFVHEPENLAAPAMPEQVLANSAADRELAATNAERHRTGEDCLSPWDGSNSDLVKQVKSVLRNPDSFAHASTVIWPVTKPSNKHKVIMKYRAQNGFGGMNVGVVEALIDPETCDATITTNLT